MRTISRNKCLPDHMHTACLNVEIHCISLKNNVWTCRTGCDNYRKLLKAKLPKNNPTQTLTLNP